MIEYIVSCGIILAGWAVAALCKHRAEAKANLQAMSGEELIEQGL